MTVFNREDSRTVLPQLEKMLEPVDTYPKIVSTSGNIEVRHALRVGRIVFLFIRVSNSSAVASGSNVAEGKLKTHIPMQMSTGAGYWGGRCFICAVMGNGVIRVRNASSQSLSANEEVDVSVTYVMRKE